MVPLISCSDLYVRLGDDDVLVIDCRDQEEWERFELHVPGALHIAPEELAEVAQSLPDDELIILCGRGRAERNARYAWHRLQHCGRAAVCLEGGLEEWITLGFPTERHGASPELSEPAARHA